MFDFRFSGTAGGVICGSRVVVASGVAWRRVVARGDASGRGRDELAADSLRAARAAHCRDGRAARAGGRRQALCRYWLITFKRRDRFYRSSLRACNLNDNLTR
ncbi:unnamed protein product [Colias eurytheme]|nr:unnamed protein product [Colias eurytheme]